MKQADPNLLIKETSPYLLQHAYNPVRWHAWNHESLERARDENKLMLVSIGYSACHWCHVMEHESFEDPEVAGIMNKHFINIKVDREERPDIDQVYMNAVQMMMGQGGWPLNCFTLPDGKPVYGGTYFPKQQWMSVLRQLAEIWNKEPGRLQKNGNELAEGIKAADLNKSIAIQQTIDYYEKKEIDDAYIKWSASFDRIEGGSDHAPKFPMPNNYEFLLRYYYHTGNKECLDHVLLTLNKMANGGIYDHTGGGFARYSTDKIWKVPHFEKMLYDNAQLVTIYTQAFKVTQNPLYKSIVFETLAFIKREMTSPEGGFYTAIDADSEGIEGKFYVWKKNELEKILGNKFKIFSEVFNINDYGYWEHDNYILMRKEQDETIAERNNLSPGELKSIIEEAKKLLLAERSKRQAPGVDDKILCSWNGLMIKAYTEAYTAFAEPEFLKTAVTQMDFILNKMSRDDGGLYHNYKNGKPSINGFLEDYCFTIEALLALYEAAFSEFYLTKAGELMKFVMKHFFDPQSELFYFTSDADPALITRKKETEDNVIPSSNSSIAKSLFLLGHYFENASYTELSKKMTLSVKAYFSKYPSAFSNWGMVILNHLYAFYEIAVAGAQAEEKRKLISALYMPDKLLAGSIGESNHPLLKNRFVKDKTLIYICENQHCLLPNEDVNEALAQIKK